MARQKKRWAELTSKQKAGVVALVALQATLAGIAQRDLAERDQSAVRGPRTVWKFLTLQPIGALAYLIGGRKPRTAAAV